MLGLTIVSASICGSTLFLTAKDQSGVVSQWSEPWATAQTQGYEGVVAWVQAQGAATEQAVPDWVAQLVNTVV